MSAWPRLILTPIHGTPDWSITVVVQDEIRMSPLTAKPYQNTPLRLRNSRAHRVLRGRAISIGRGAGNVLLTRQTLTELLFGLPYMLAENVATRSFVPAEIARWASLLTLGPLTFVPRSGR